jgi:hypothetical protein
MTTTCKHNWNFTGPNTLACTRCGAETGPKPSEERVKDILEAPRAWYTVAELNDWAVKYLDKHKEKQA